MHVIQTCLDTKCYSFNNLPFLSKKCKLKLIAEMVYLNMNHSHPNRIKGLKNVFFFFFHIYCYVIFPVWYMVILSAEAPSLSSRIDGKANIISSDDLQFEQRLQAIRKYVLSHIVFSPFFRFLHISIVHTLTSKLQIGNN